MTKDMLGQVVRTIVGLPGEMLGTLADLIEKLGSDSGQEWLTALKKFLRKENPWENLAKDIPQLLQNWEQFYRRTFGIDIDLSEVEVPAKRKGFERLIVVIPGMTSEKIYAKCAELFKTGKYADNLDESVNSERSAQNGFYAVWIRDRVEADEELKNFSANQLKKKNIPGITLEERLLLELKYFQETGEHLDIKNVTLCSGSRISDGIVPNVGWDGGKMRVSWCISDDWGDDLRSRESVSFAKGGVN